MKRVFSAVRPSGFLHLGHLAGVISEWTALQARYEAIFAIADYHAITTPYSPRGLPALVFETLAWFLAAGFDPEQTIIFRQSDIPAHTALAWILSTLTPLGELSRMTQFKEKRAEAPKSVNAGLLNYPILMAADILLYKAELVPVGEDQRQHLEFSRELARRFNRRFGLTFPLPEALLKEGAKIMSLKNPQKKMAKTRAGEAILLDDRPTLIRQKILAAVTDVGPQKGRAMSPGVKNLMTLLKIFASPPVFQRFENDYRRGIMRYAPLKEELAQAITRTLTPLKERKRRLLAQPKQLEAILKAGAQKASKIAGETLREVKTKIGLEIRR